MTTSREKSKKTRFTAIVLAILILVESIVPNLAFALSGGPSQPEVEGFTPAGTTDMVDLFTGDFSYNIPLMDVDGYPLNLGYQSGVSMDQEASWVGLGWNLNPGSINRSMRGVPDDFNGGEVIKKYTYIKPSFTMALTGAASVKLFALPIFKSKSKGQTYLGGDLSLNLKLFYNNYKGIGADLSSDLNFSTSTVKEIPPAPTVPPAPADSSKPKDAEAKENKDNKVKKISASEALKKTVNKLFQDNVIKNIPGNGLYSSLTQKTVSTDKGIKATTQTTSRDISGVFKGAANDIALISSYMPSNVGYMPKLNNDMINHSYSFDMFFGGYALGIFGSPSLKLSVDYEAIQNNYTQTKAVGSYYHNNDQDNSVLLDFSRDHEGEYSRNKPILPMPVNMYDIYSISGNGAGGMFRNMKNGVMMFYDNRSISEAHAAGGTVELGAAIDVHTKAGGSYTYNFIENSRWSSGNEFNEVTKKAVTGATPEFEPNYFKLTGEKSAINTSLLNNKNIGVSYKPQIENVSLFDKRATNKLIANNNQSDVLSEVYGGNLYDNKRVIKSQYISVLTYAEKSAFQRNILPQGNIMFSPKISFPTNNTSASNNTLGEENPYTNSVDYSFSSPANTYDVYSNEVGDFKVRRNNHIGQITLNKTDGSRYVYGIAAYNNSKIETTCNIGNVESKLNRGTNLVRLEGGIEGYFAFNGANKGYRNERESDGYYNRVETPSYAHSYLLTEVLQPDYVDLYPTGKTGPEDLGNYTKFNYVRTAKDFPWRIPSDVNKATFIEGQKSITYDNKASVVEGTKELWYVKTIESKNHVALFVIEPRKDNIAYNGLNTKELEKTTFRLRRIVLYTREEFEKTQTPLTNATPIKTVWFTYDYSLCQGIDNFASASVFGNLGNPGAKRGKLTLKEVFFTYGNSTKKVNSYKFNYDAGNPVYSTINPGYNQSNVDRWGNYKSPIDGINNIDFPYVEQDKAKADINASAWLLSEIKLPSGGIINVKYESDDYAYVQDKRACQMMKIAAVGSNGNFPTENINLLYKNGVGSIDNKNFIFFKFPSDINTDDKRKNYMYECVDKIQNLSFKILMSIGGGTNSGQEWINGYASVHGCGVASNNPEYFFIKLKQEDMESLVSTKFLHPFSKAGFEFVKTNLPFVVNPTSFSDMADGGADIEDYAYKLLGISDLIDKLFGVNDKLLERELCRDLVLGQSFCRLNEPFKKKLGGGVRVKKIVMNDSWAGITGSSLEKSEEFGQEFAYTTTEMSQGVERIISSGVASYEPSSGSEENPFRQPIAYSKDNFLMPDEDEMIEGPIGESFFPSPSVGYSRVTVTNLGRTLADKSVSSHGVGKTVSEYYTAKDFPTIVEYTDVTDARASAPLINFLVYQSSSQRKYFTQGFAVQCNDMHGKPKSVEVFKQRMKDETNDKLLTGTYYKYKTSTTNPKKLDNSNVSVINDLGIESKKTIGVESELIADSRQRIFNSDGGNINITFETINLIFFILPITPSWPLYTESMDNFYSSTANKISTTFGIIDEVRVIQDGSEITTKNVSFDENTGEVLVTKTINEYKKDVFNTTYPAHWIYDNMGFGYKNIGITVPGVFFNSTLNGTRVNITGTTASKYFCKGDEVLLYDRDGNLINKKFIINQIGTDYILYDAENCNSPVVTSFNGKIKIIRSGRRNMHSSPIFTATTLLNPITGSTIQSPIPKLVIDASKKIIDAKAITYQIDQTRYKSFREEVKCDLSPASKILSDSNNNSKSDIPSSSKDSLAQFQNESLNCYGSFVGLEFSNFNHNSQNVLCHKSVIIKPQTSYLYKGDRVTNNFVQEKFNNTKGVYTDFTDFYNLTTKAISTSPKWKMAEKSTLFDPYTGAEAESRDALNRARSMVFYKDQFKYTTADFAISSKPQLYVENGEQSDVTMFNFENDNEVSDRSTAKVEGTFLTDKHYFEKHQNPTFAYITSPADNIFHTGNKSLKLTGFQIIKANFYINYSSSIFNTTNALTPFFPKPDIKYLLSAWVKSSNSSSTTNKIDAWFVIKHYSGKPLDHEREVIFKPSGPVIDGWQRVTGEFTITNFKDGENVTWPAKRLELTLMNTGNTDLYFDDIRIQPFDAQVKNYIYDEQHRVKAMLDENNYATYYIYNIKGELVSIRKETEKGIVTIQENRKNNSSFNNKP